MTIQHYPDLLADNPVLTAAKPAVGQRVRVLDRTPDGFTHPSREFDAWVRGMPSGGVVLSGNTLIGACVQYLGHEAVATNHWGGDSSHAYSRDIVEVRHEDGNLWWWPVAMLEELS